MLKRILVAFMMILLVACTKVTSENFAKIQTDMTYEEVVKILGEPTSQQSLKLGQFAATNATWKYKNRTISIQFLDNKVKMKTYVDESQKTNHP